MLRIGATRTTNVKINELFESAYSAGVSDGMRGQRDPRASAKYGPEASEYVKGYSAGLRKGEEEREKRGQQRDAELAPYRSMDEKELLNLEKELLSRRKEIADIAQKKRGVSLDFDPQKHGLSDELKQENKDILTKLRLIDIAKDEKGIEITEGTRCQKGYEKKGMKTHYGKRVPNCVKKEGIEVDDEGAIAIVNFKKKFDWDKVSNLADRFGIGMDVLDNNTTHGEPGKYYLQADFYDDIDEFGEILYFKYDNELISMDELTEDLKKWFGDGKKGGAGGGGWDAYNSKGERIGKCGETDGRAKPKCLSKSKAASLRNSDANDDGKKDGKAGIARAVKRKRRKDPNPDREGKAKNVKNKS